MEKDKLNNNGENFLRDHVLFEAIPYILLIHNVSYTISKMHFFFKDSFITL